MNRYTVSDIAAAADQRVTLEGWLYNKRSSGKLAFLQLRDGTGIIQCVVSRTDVDADSWQAAEQLTQESALRVTGVVRADPRSPLGFELAVERVEVVSIAAPYPITKKEHQTAFLMAHRHLWLRSPRQQAILRIRATVIRAIRDYFDSHGFLLLDTPILTPAACEGTTTLFETKYFDEMAYLTQSGQLYNEANAMAFGKVYCFGPTFRAEKSKTRRHLTEFWMVEPEMAYHDLADTMDLAEDFLVSIVERVLNEHRADLARLERDPAPLERVQKPFVRLHYREAVAKLRTLGSDIPEGDDFGGDDETLLTQQYDRPVIVHRYPAQVKAFYMKRDPADPEASLSMDLLAPEGYGEIVGGGQREDDLATLEAAIERHGLPRAAFEWYLDLRRYGSCPHAGFGLGVERTVTWLCGLKHVRETIPFPRMLEKMVF